MRLFFTMIQLLVAVFSCTHALEHTNSIGESDICSETSEKKSPENVFMNPSLKVQLQWKKPICTTEKAEDRKSSTKPQSKNIGSTEKAEGRKSSKKPQSKNIGSTEKAEGRKLSKKPQSKNIGYTEKAEGRKSSEKPQSKNIGTTEKAEGQKSSKKPQIENIGSTEKAEGRKSSKKPQSRNIGSTEKAEGQKSSKKPQSENIGTTEKAEGQKSSEKPQSKNIGSTEKAEGQKSSKKPKSTNIGFTEKAEGQKSSKKPQSKNIGSTEKAEDQKSSKKPQSKNIASTEKAEGQKSSKKPQSKNIGSTENAEGQKSSKKRQSKNIGSTQKAEKAGLKSSGSNAASEESYFPYLNLTSITMLDENNHPVEGFFTHPSTGRSAAAIEKTMSDIEYIVYTSEKPNGTAVKYAEELKNTTFNPEKPVKLITHGWLSSGSADTCMNIKDGYLNTTDVNVIVMDWREIANDYYYINPMRAVPKVAHHYAIFINDMINNLKVEPKNIHLIGHSLGAHISGLVWKDMEGKKPERVTGLDPAFPGFDHIFMFNERISNESGAFVDIIHSCGGLLGILDPLGHADFYPNGGTAAQPGCSNLLEACSHGRSWQFFADSVQYPKRKFLATRCDSWDQFVSNKCDDSENIIMGEFAQHSARGKYFLRTNPAKPFSKYEIN